MTLNVTLRKWSITADDPRDIYAIKGEHKYSLESLDLTETPQSNAINYNGWFVPFAGADSVDMRRRFERIGQSFNIVLNGENRPFRQIKGCSLLSHDPTNYAFIAHELDEE
jgi:hypothetical protein